MNLFLVGVGVSESMKRAATTALTSITTIYPQLDAATLQCWHDGQTFVGSIQTNYAAASPREYVAKCGDCLTLFTGTPISADSELVPHRARDLASHWDQLPTMLDGQFAVVQVDWKNRQLEVLTDPLGMEQVYVHQRGPIVVVSNSVRLIEQTCGLTALDEIGVSLMLSLGWVGGDRTLRDLVQALPGGACHRWTFNGVHTSVPYWSSTGLTCLRQRYDEARVQDVADRFVAMMRGLNERFGPLLCDLTGGRDSRVLVAIAIASGVPATFVTEGAPGSADVRIAADIARACQLTHLIDHPKATVIERWDDGVARLIRQNDGMVDLWQIANCITQDPRVACLPVELWGSGGEIARGFYHHHMQLPLRLSERELLRTFPSRLVKPDELLTKDARSLALESIRGTCLGLLGDGVAPDDVPDAFYAFDRVRRWAGTNARKVAPICDLFTPFCTRPFLEAAFAMPLRDRIAGRLHMDLIGALQPALLNIPFDKSLLPVQTRSTTQSVVEAVRGLLPGWVKRLKPRTPVGTGPVQADWVEAKRNWIREVCLSQPRSVVWDYVDPRAFERMLSPTTDTQMRRAYCQRILSIATVCHYEADTH